MGLFDWLKQLFSSEPPLPAPDVGYDIGELAKRLRIEPRELANIKPSYHSFTIPKRRGGSRTIHAPAADLKQMQRIILRRLLGHLEAHPAATGFERGKSIVTHALPHALQPVIVKMDIREFFPSTHSKRVHAYFRRIGWNDEAARTLTTICTWDGGLPQGAPTSPRLANLVNYRMDTRLAAMANMPAFRYQNPKTLEERPRDRVATICYTRYADDITLSFGADVHAMVNSAIWLAKRIVEEEGYRLHTKKKLRIMRQHDRQIVTGLVVNAGVNLPRQTRRWLRAVEHRLATRGHCSLSDSELEGWRALQHMITTQSGLDQV